MMGLLVCASVAIVAAPTYVRAAESTTGMVKNELTYAAAMGSGTRVTAKSSHAQVMGMQQALKDKGFDPGTMDGVMGPKTVSALRDYQKSQNLTTTGRLDGDTSAKLGVPVSTEKR